MGRMTGVVSGVKPNNDTFVVPILYAIHIIVEKTIIKDRILPYFLDMAILIITQGQRNSTTFIYTINLTIRLRVIIQPTIMSVTTNLIIGASGNTLIGHKLLQMDDRSLVNFLHAKFPPLLLWSRASRNQQQTNYILSGKQQETLFPFMYSYYNMLFCKCQPSCEIFLSYLRSFPPVPGGLLYFFPHFFSSSIRLPDKKEVFCSNCILSCSMLY